MNKVKGSKILVTGGAGFIGSYIAEELLKEGADVVVYDNLIRGRKENIMSPDKIEFVEGDIRDYGKLNNLMKDIDYVFHEAAVAVRRCLKYPEESIDVNIKGSFNVFKSCVENKVKKIIFASSASVYGNTIYSPMNEEHPKNPISYYCVSKLACEHYLRVFAKQGLKNISFRYMNVYGPRQSVDAFYTSVIINFLNEIRNGRPPVIHGDGSQTFDFVHVRDVARANVMALKSDITDEVFNLGGEEVVSIKQLAEMIIELTGSNLKPVYQPEKLVLVKKRVGDITKIKKMLGFEPTIKFRDGLKEVIEDFNRQPEFYLGGKTD